MRFLSMLRVVSFSLLSFGSVAFSALPPLPSLTSLPSLSAALTPPPPVLSAPAVSAFDKPAQPPLMLDAPIDKSSEVMGGAHDADSVRLANIQRVIEALSSLEKLVSQFHLLQESIDVSYVGFDKKLDSFYQDVFSAVGKFTAVFETVTKDLADRDAQGSDAPLKDLIFECRTALADGSKMQSDLKDARTALDKAEDGVRASVVAFKKTRVDFATNYGKASSLKNDILVQAGDGKNQADQVVELQAKTQNLYDQINSKDMPAIKASMKKIEEGLTKSSVDVVALSSQMEKVKACAGSISKAAPAIVPKGEKLVEKKVAEDGFSIPTIDVSHSLDKPLLDVASDSGAVHVGKSMAFEVLGTIGQGGKAFWLGSVSGFYSVKNKILSALAISRAVSADPVLGERRAELKTSAMGFGVGAWKLCVSAFNYVKQIFVQFASRARSSENSTVEPAVVGAEVSALAVAPVALVKGQAVEASSAIIPVLPLNSTSASVSLPVRASLPVEVVLVDKKKALLPKLEVSSASLPLPIMPKKP